MPAEVGPREDAATTVAEHDDPLACERTDQHLIADERHDPLLELGEGNLDWSLRAVLAVVDDGVPQRGQDPGPAPDVRAQIGQGELRQVAPRVERWGEMVARLPVGRIPFDVPVVRAPGGKAPIRFVAAQAVEQQQDLAVGAPLRGVVRFDLEEAVVGAQEGHDRPSRSNTSTLVSTRSRSASRTVVVVVRCGRSRRRRAVWRHPSPTRRSRRAGSGSCVA